MANAAKKRTKLTLDELLDNNEDVYVLNMSGRESGMKGIIHITFIDTSGKTRPLTIDRTWLPVNLTERVGRNALKDSQDLRGMIYKGFLDLVEPEEAVKMLQSEDAKIELDRLRQNASSSRNFNPIVNESKQETKVLSPESSARMNQGLNPMSTDDRVNPKVRDILLRVESGDLQPKMAVAEIRSIASDLRTEDASYIISAAMNQQVKNYGQQLLMDLNSRVENPFGEEKAEKVLRPSKVELDESNRVD